MKSTCVHFPECGGCSVLNVDYTEQLKNKRAYLQKLFAGFDIEIPDIVPSPQHYFYRHKVQLPFAYYKKGQKGNIALGCYGVDSHKVIDQRECLIQDKDLTRIACIIREWAERCKLTVYNEKNGSGFLRHVLLRKAAGTGEILIGLVTNGDRPDGSRQMANWLIEAIGKAYKGNVPVVGIVQNVNKRSTNVVLGSVEHIWWGRPYLKELLGNYKFKVEMSTFFQVNPYQTPQLYTIALNALPEGGRVLDLYCGVGSISLWLTKKADEVVGLEENPNSVRAAKTAASLNGVKNVKFITGDVAELLPDWCNKGFSCAVIDPPRKGMESNVVNSINHSTLKRLVYVSCNPETLCRDAKLLGNAFTLKQLTGVDMFPHTEHIEAVAVFGHA
jgi:23S rRNA (uracil1939-C5)-methyltransferase